MKFQDTFDYFDNKYTELTHDVMVEKQEEKPLQFIIDSKQSKPTEERVEQVIEEEKKASVVHEQEPNEEVELGSLDLEEPKA